MKPYPSAPLGDVCVIVGGGTPRRGNEAYFNGAIPWVKPTDITAAEDLFIEQTGETISELGLRESSARLVPAGTVLLTSRATIGYTAVASKPVATNQGLANLICSERLHPEYVAFWLRGQRDRLIQLAGGTTFKEISKSALKQIGIPLPPLDEQRRIASILNRAARIERLRARAADRFREFVPALFIKMFGDPVENPMEWRIEPLGAYCILTQYGTSKKANDRAKGVPVLRMGNVTYDGYLNCTDLKYTELTEADTEKYALHVGDILFNRTNSKELVGKTGIWDGRFEAVAASYFIRLKVKENALCPVYVWAFMNSSAMKRRLFRTARGAVGQANINAKELESLPLPVPPLKHQRQYAEIVKAIHGTVRFVDSSQKISLDLGTSLYKKLLL